MTTTFTSPLDIDATVAAGSTDNHGRAQFLTVQTGTSDVGTRRIYTSGVRSFPLSVRILSAKIRARQQTPASSATRTLALRPVTEKWGESTIRWSRQPETDATQSVDVTVAGPGQAGRVVEWDVTAITQRIADGAPFFGFRIHSLSSERLRFWSRESPAGGLEWEVTYTTAPPPPSRLSPSAGRAVSVARPTLTFATPNAIDGYRVQLFDGGADSVVPSVPLEARIASFNICGNQTATFPARLPGIVSTILTSGAEALSLQELRLDGGQPAALESAMQAANPAWRVVLGKEKHYLVDTSTFTHGKARDFAPPTGGSVGALPLTGIESGETVPLWNAHLSAGDARAADRITQINAAIPWLAALGPRVGGADMNSATLLSGRPLALLAQAGNLQARTLVDEVTNGHLNSFDGYGTNPGQGKWIDHLFVAGGPQVTAVGLTDSGDASDHNLIWMDIVHSTETINVGDLGAPTFDTGDRDGTVGLWQLERDVALDEVVWYRVFVRRDGEWSEPSDPTYFRRVAKKPVTILNPGVAPDDYVTEPTPPFIWVSEDQDGYRALVTDPLDHTRILWDSRRQGGDAQTVTPRTPLGLTIAGQYRLEVRTWDDVPREDTPDDPSYAVDERLFTFALSGTVAPVTSIDVTQPDERPWARVAFTMPTASDQVEVLRRRVDEPDAPLTSLGVFTTADLHVSGSTYAFIDRLVPPQADHEWVVRRLVNGATSAGNPSKVGRVMAYGAWLCSLDGAHAIKITTEGNDPVRWSPDENVELQRPVGGRVAHPVTHAIFGRQGDLSGYVRPWKGQSLREAKIATAAMRPPIAPYGTPMVLTQVDEAVRVFWVGVVTDRRHEFVEKFGIEAELHEVPDGVA